ncbi:DEAD/DEAH box helicase [Candidatus Lokiarchaeum ossiferum]|uniref:DEAD/DEAH box helicase n=1 Tax=Candidatus Lokiarchaeum ossiferum TaxID=2951803 RepID=UPI00352DDA93
MESSPLPLPRFDPITLEGKILRPKQEIAFGKIQQGLNVVANFEMGYGKTFLALKLAQQMKDEGKKFIMGVPLKAVASQMEEVFAQYFHVLIVSGDHIENKTKILDDGYDGYIMTYEMMLQYLIKARQRHILYENIGAFIIDEVHIMASGRRGATIESNVMLVRHFYPSIQILLLSATIQNNVEFAHHFDCDLVQTTPDERPVKLVKKIIARPQYSRSEEEYEHIAQDVKEIICKHTQSSTHFPGMLVFCNARLLSKKLAQELTAHFPYIDAEYHNASLTPKRRKTVEKAFATQKINVICCTPTLAMGINLPSAICVLTSVRRRSGLINEKVMLDSNEIIQMAGRAGRPGQKGNLLENIDGHLQEYGISYTMCEYPDYEEIEHMINTPVIITSQIPDHIKWVLLTWIVAGITHIDELQQFYATIFTESVNLIHYANEFQWLVDKKFIDVDSQGNILASHKAKMTAFFGIRCETTQHFYFIREILKKEFFAGKLKTLHPATLFCLLLACDEFSTNIRASGKLDKASITTANHFCDSPLLYHLLGASKFQCTINEAVKKGFAITYDSYLQQRYLESACPPENQKCVFQQYDAGDQIQTHMVAARLLTAASAILGHSWSFGRVLKGLKEGIESPMACFDTSVVDLQKAPHVGGRTAILLSEAHISSRKQLHGCNPHIVRSKLKKIVHGKNERVKILSHQFSRRRDPWKLPPEKTLEKIRKKALDSKFPSTANIKRNEHREKQKKANSLLAHIKTL